MLTGAGSLHDPLDQTSITARNYGATCGKDLALGADEAGFLGRLLAVEPDLGGGATVAGRFWNVVLHRALVALDGEALRRLATDVDALAFILSLSAARGRCNLAQQGCRLILGRSRIGHRLAMPSRLGRLGTRGFAEGVADHCGL